MSWYRWRSSTPALELELRLRVQPGARHRGWGEVLEDQRRIRIAAPATDGKANAALRSFIASACGVTTGRVALVAGTTGRDKRVRVSAPNRLPDGVSWPTDGPS
jgi:hypothetical protein